MCRGKAVSAGLLLHCFQHWVHHFVTLKNNFIYLFIFGSAGFSLLHGLVSNCGEWEPLSSCGVQASHCGGFFYWGARALGCTDFSSCGPQALEHRLNICSPLSWLLCSMWHLTGSEVEPVSPALPGRFFTTETLGKPHFVIFSKPRSQSDSFLCLVLGASCPTHKCHCALGGQDERERGVVKNHPSPSRWWVGSVPCARQGSLACCNPWGSQRVRHDWATEQHQQQQLVQDATSHSSHPIPAVPFIIQKLNLTWAIAGWNDPSGNVQIAHGGEWDDWRPGTFLFLGRVQFSSLHSQHQSLIPCFLASWTYFVITATF